MLVGSWSLVFVAVLVCLIAGDQKLKSHGSLDQNWPSSKSLGFSLESSASSLDGHF